MYNSKRTRRWVLQTTGATVGGALVIGSASADEHIIREEAELTDEAHGLDTGASGLATFEVNVEEGVVEYEVHIDRICDPTQAHVHMGGPNEDGPIVAWLYPEDQQEPRHIKGFFSGLLAEGTITPDDFGGPLEGLSFEEASTMLEEEGAYVNVHTEEHPGGEIRGQIEPVEPIEEPEDDTEEPPEDDGDDEEEDEPPEDDDEDEDEDEDPVDPADALEVTDIEVLGSDPDEEYIEITNTSDENVDLSGYEVWDQEGGAVENRNQPEGPYVFQDFVLEANSSVQLWTGDGEDDNENVYWGESLQLWAQDGDTVRIYDSDGELVVRYEYESQESLLLWLTQLFF